MNISDWIALSSSLATFITAVVGYFTLREMSKQRRHLFKPELILVKQIIKCYFGNDFSFFWSSLDIREINEKGKNFQCHVNLFNLGSGAAKDIKIIWICDYKKISDEINSISEINSIDSFVNYDRGALTFYVDGERRATWFTQNEQFDELNYLLPISMEYSPGLVKIPGSFINMVSLYYHVFLLSCSRKNGNDLKIIEINEDMCKIIMRILYQDTAGGIHNLEFILKVHLSSHRKTEEKISYYGLEKEIFTAKLEFTKKK